MPQGNDLSLATAARMAAIGYLVMIIIAPFSFGYVYSGLVIPGDAVTSVANIQTNETLFRIGSSLFIFVILADVVVSIGLYYYLSPVNKGLSLLAAWLRIIYVAIFAVALNSLFGLLYLATNLIGLNQSGAMYEQEVLSLVHNFDYGWLIGLVFFGFHLLLIGGLIIRSAYMPKLLGWLVMLSGAAYIIDSFAHFILADYDAYKGAFTMLVMIAATLGELYLCLWLFIRGKAGAERASA